MAQDQYDNERFRRGLAKMLELGGTEAGSTHSKLIDNYRELADDLPNLIVEFPRWSARSSTCSRTWATLAA